MNIKNYLVALILGLVAGCGSDLGACDNTKLDVDLDGVADGQLAVNSACVACHSATSVGIARRGAPFGLNFDVPSSVVDEYGMQVFNAGQTNVKQYAEEMWSEIEAGSMPPAGPLPEATKDQVRNWLACGAQASTERADPSAMPMGSFDTVYTLMEASNCGACHGPAAPMARFTWGPDACTTYKAIYMQPAAGDSCTGQGAYVVPMSPETSVLVQKLSAQPTIACGSPMPLGQPMGLQGMNPAAYTALLEWVMAGAPPPAGCTP